jgi:hypothetical protein
MRGDVDMVGVLRLARLRWVYLLLGKIEATPSLANYIFSSSVE